MGGPSSNLTGILRRRENLGTQREPGVAVHKGKTICKSRREDSGTPNLPTDFKLPGL